MSALIDTGPYTRDRNVKKKKTKTRKIKLGNYYLSRSFAGPSVRVCATRYDPDRLGFFGKINKKDMLKLIDAGVPFNINRDLKSHEVFVFFDQIIDKKQNKSKKRRRVIK